MLAVHAFIDFLNDALTLGLHLGL